MRAYSSTVRYSPDPVLGESMNVGVALACPETGYFKFRFADQIQTRIRQLDPSFTYEHYHRVTGFIRKSSDGFRSEILASQASSGDGAPVAVSNQVDVLNGFVRRFGTGSKVGLTPFREVIVNASPHPSTLDDVLNHLFERHVNYRLSLDKAADHSPRFVDRVETILTEDMVYSTALRDYKVEAANAVYDLAIEGPNSTLLFEMADIQNPNSSSVMANKLGPILFNHKRVLDSTSSLPFDPKLFTILSGVRDFGKAVHNDIKYLRDVSDVYFVEEKQQELKLKQKVKSLVQL